MMVPKKKAEEKISFLDRFSLMKLRTDAVLASLCHNGSLETSIAYCFSSSSVTGSPLSTTFDSMFRFKLWYDTRDWIKHCKIYTIVTRTYIEEFVKGMLITE